jgi:hypothetical protein
MGIKVNAGNYPSSFKAITTQNEKGRLKPALFQIVNRVLGPKKRAAGRQSPFFIARGCERAYATPR